jgi:class 3 adenylate cyclase/tetratricopeptide (TPR) repeat protein
MQICPNCGEENPPRFKLCGFCGAQLAAPLEQEIRKTATIVFTDLVGSTALGTQLDPEALREVISRYFDEMRRVLEEHGGLIEKFIGDAVMAVFGLPRVREDDALRAVRAAAEMRTALARLNDDLERAYGVRLQNRTGIKTGEVVSGDPTSGQRLVTGDTVNLAARLEQAAPTDEILMGDITLRLVKDWVEVEELEPLKLKGQPEPVAAFRLLRVLDGPTTSHRFETTLVGRDEDLAVLRAALVDVIETQAPQLATVIGEPGVGKSRLVEELAGAAGDGAQFLSGRCLPYGRGITFWPLVEIVRQAADIDETDPPDLALAKIEALVPDAEPVTARVASAIGLGPAEYPLDEIYWGTRKLFEALAAERPLIIEIEDIHTGEQAFLDLIEHVATSAVAPILLVCTTRPELLERLPEWSAEPINLRIELEPLSAEQTAAIVYEALGETEVAADIYGRVVSVAGGNPLFVEHLLSMLIDDGFLSRDADGWHAVGDLTDFSLPDSIQALLEARLELLEREERAVLGPASVIGVVFDREALATMVPEQVRGDLDTLLDRLVDRRFLRTTDGEGEWAYEFHHNLVRDVAYSSLLKRARAKLHETFVEWAEGVNRDRDRTTEHEELLGYHLEQAHGYLAELAPLDEHARELGARASAYLASAGERAFSRGDMIAASNLLRRAAMLLPRESRDRLALLPDLGEALMEMGEFPWAVLFLEEAVEDAAKLGDEVLEADAILTQLLVRRRTGNDLESWEADVERETKRLIPILEAAGADSELAKAWRMASAPLGAALRLDDAAAAQQRVLFHARASGARRAEARAAGAYAQLLVRGPTPTSVAISRCGDILAAGLVDQQAEALTLIPLAHLRAMTGSFAEARELYRSGLALLHERGDGVIGNAMSVLGTAQVELLGNDLVAAETLLRSDLDHLTTMDERYFRPVVAGRLASVLVLAGRHSEALELANAAADLATPDDIEAQAIWRSALARASVEDGGDPENSTSLALQAVALLRPTQAPVLLADALLDLAIVQASAGDEVAAVLSLTEATQLYAAKEHTIGARLVDEVARDAGLLVPEPSAPL